MLMRRSLMKYQRRSKIVMKAVKPKKYITGKSQKTNVGTQSTKKKRRYKTRGYGSKKIKNPKPFKHDFFAKYGSIIKVETGGEITDLHCAYVGFGTNPINITHKAVGRAVIKELFSQMGISIARFDDQFEGVGFAYDLEVKYLSSPVSATLTTNTVVLAVNPTFETVAGNFCTQMVNLLILVPRLVLDSVRLVERTGGASAQIRGQIIAGNFGLNIQSSGSLSIQNRTKSSDNSSSNTDITNNPLHGKVYSGIGNYFEVRKFVDQGATFPFLVEGTTPVFAVRSQDYQLNVSRKPFNAQDLVNVRKTTDVVLQPGQIRSGSLYYSKKINLKNFYRDYHEPLAGPLTETHKLGKIYMVGLEKMVNDRTAEPDISIGYEVNLTVKCAGIYRRKIESVTIIQEI